MKPLALALAAVVAAGAAQATTFTDQAAFLAAVGAPLTTEDFEAQALSGTAGSGGLASIDFGAFAVGSTPDAVKVLDTPEFGAGPSSGTRYLFIDTDEGLVGSTTTFTFDSAFEAFGFFLTGVNTGGASFEVSFGGETVSIPIVLGTGVSPRFIGYVGTALTGFSITTDDDSAYGVDDVSYGRPAPAIPLPAGLPLVLSALAGFALVRRRG